MIDPKILIENPAFVTTMLENRGMNPRTAKRLVNSVVESIVERKQYAAVYNQLKTERNQLTTEIGLLLRNGEDAVDLKDRAAALSVQIAEAKTLLTTAEENEEAMLLDLPNIPSVDVPVGDETANLVISHKFSPKATPTPDHVAIGERSGLMDFTQTAKMSGSRFSTLFGPLAKLERAIGNWMLDTHTAHGFREVSPPHMVNRQAMEGTGQFPKFEDDAYSAGEDHFLIPTGEVSLANLVRQSIIDGLETPMRMVALTPCYRAEAGSAGKDTRGIIRQHQFKKVEMVSVCRPEQSNIEHEFMLVRAQEILDKLYLPYRTVLLSTGDMGLSANKTYDIEVWLPSQNAYREIASISNCGDFQARRMDARFRRLGSKPEFLHTLNGSGLAVGRTLVAIMENYYADGMVVIPEILVPYMGVQYINVDH